MGAADIVPGVSGGTIALVLGIYPRLVGAISRFDLLLVSLVRKGRWRDAAAHVDLRFLLALGTGILAGIVALASTMNSLLTQEATRSLTLAAFFGLIVASSTILARNITLRRGIDAIGPILLGACAAGLAFWLTGLRPAAAQITLWYVFGCGSLAICAMILPGISGAFILLILGVYVPITGILRRLGSFDAGLDEVATLGVFAAGCAVGLLAFSKVLRWILSRYEAPMMGLLAGFMVGSLRKIWPFENDVTLDYAEQLGLSPETIEAIRRDPRAVEQLDLNHRAMENMLPESLTADVALAAAVAALALVCVVAADAVARRRNRRAPRAEAPGRGT
jgi:putative membrane protein